MSIYSDIDDALSWLVTFIDKVDRENLATNNEDYTDCKLARAALKRALQSLKNLEG